MVKRNFILVKFKMQSFNKHALSAVLAAMATVVRSQSITNAYWNDGNLSRVGWQAWDKNNKTTMSMQTSDSMTLELENGD